MQRWLTTSTSGQDKRSFPMSPQFQCWMTPMVGISHPTDHDVKSGRGVVVNSHPGNRRFRALVNSHKELYVTSNKNKKRAVALRIISEIRSLNPPGRFLEKDPTEGTWSDIGDDRALEKTCQALRNGAAAVRGRLNGPELLSKAFNEDTHSHSHDHKGKQPAQAPETGLWSDGGGPMAMEKTSQASRNDGGLEKEPPLDLSYLDFIEDVFDAGAHAPASPLPNTKNPETALSPNAVGNTETETDSQDSPSLRKQLSFDFGDLEYLTDVMDTDAHAPTSLEDGKTAQEETSTHALPGLEKNLPCQLDDRDFLNAVLDMPARAPTKPTKGKACKEKIPAKVRRNTKSTKTNASLKKKARSEGLSAWRPSSPQDIPKIRIITPPSTPLGLDPQQALLGNDLMESLLDTGMMDVL